MIENETLRIIVISIILIVLYIKGVFTGMRIEAKRRERENENSTKRVS